MGCTNSFCDRLMIVDPFLLSCDSRVYRMANLLSLMIVTDGDIFYCYPLKDSIDCPSCTFVERLIMDMITSVRFSYW